MQKKQTWNVKTLVFMALLIAMHLVLTRVLVIDLGAYRISVGSVTTILAGLWLGPVAGGVCGFCADIIGCFMKGYAVNPFITVAAILWGVLPALAKPFFANRKKTGKTVGICVSIVVTAVLSSLVLTTAGLVIMLGYNFYAIMPGRLVQFAIMIPVYCVLTCLLYFSPLTAMVAGNTSPAVLKNKTVYWLLFTHHYSARCFGMNMPKSRDIQAKIPLPQAIWNEFWLRYCERSEQ